MLAALLLLASGVNATLDRLGRSPAQNSFVWYDEKGDAVLAYNGELALTQKFPRPVHVAMPFLLHRT